MGKGNQYLQGCDPKAVYWIRRKLPFMSFRAACVFYAGLQKRHDFQGQNLQRFLACNDRFYLLTAVLRRMDAQNEWLYDRCREVEAEPDEYLDLWARYHYKSTIITFAGAIQEIINDPEITIAIFGNTFEISQPFLEQIATELESNEDLKGLFPEVFYADPRKEAQTWSKREGIVVKRKSNPKELTVQAFGLMEALPTGGHWKLRIYDDIVTLKSVTQTTTDQIGKTVIRWQMSQNLGTHEGGRRWVLGTRYSYADAYSSMIEARSVKVRTHAATHDGTLSGRPVFLSDEAWAKVKRDQRDVIAAQMLQNPVAAKENTFRVKFLRPYEIRPLSMNVYILVDPAGKPTSTKTDNTAMAVIGIDGNDNRYLLDGYCHKMGLSDRWLNLLNLWRRWHKGPGIEYVGVGYEKYGLQSDIEYIEEKIYAERLELSIEEVSWTRDGTQSKTARIGRLEPYFRNAAFYVPPKVQHPDYGLSTWRVVSDTEPMMVNGQQVIEPKTGAVVMVEVEGSEKIIYTPYKGPSRREAQAITNGEHYRVMQPIKRIDHDGLAYDLTRVFFEEYRLHPFAPHDDFMDAMSRIQDIAHGPPMGEAALAQVDSPPVYSE